MVPNQTAGAIGLSISGTLWCMSMWRVAFHSRPYKGSIPERPCNGCQWLTPRRGFHALLLLAMTVECVAYADLAQLLPLSDDRVLVAKVGYVLLQVVGRAFFEFLAFAVVTNLWIGTAMDSSYAGINQCLKHLPRLLLGTGCLLSLMSVWQVVDIFTSGKQHGSDWVYRGHVFVEGFSWGTQAILASVCVFMTTNRILRLSTFPQSGTKTRAAILAKPLVPMILCAVCYAVRSIWLLQQVSKLPKTIDDLPDKYGISWWVAFEWVPTLVPSTMLLYSARKRDRNPDRDQGRGSPMLTTRVPPAEAFISFQRFTEQGDLFSPLTQIQPEFNYESDEAEFT